jgi:2-polyprenyl-6-methoxyphenol hydroxylase-like FAD-dependent oxidoreductase
MRRSFLEQRLREIAEVDCGIVFTDGVALVSAEPLGGDRGVRATLSDGTTATFRAVVGCDGINSTVRSIIDPHAPQPRYVGLANFGGYTEGVSEGQPGHWHMHFGYKAFFGFARDNDGGTAWFANLPQNEPVPRETRNSRSMDDWKKELCAAFADDAGPAVKLIRAGRLDLAADNTRDLPHVPIWSRDGLIVIGDAAHAPSPSSGQGASMAIEDAVVLAQCIRDNPDSMALAFRTFEAARRERVEKIVAEGARSSNNKIAGPVGRFFRDLMLPLVFRFLVTPESNQWLYGHHIDWDMKMTAGNGK